MVVDDVEDLDVGPVGEGPVGGVGLPALVGQVGFEALPGAAWSFLGLGCDEPSSDQDPPDRGCRRRWLAAASVAELEVVGDGGRAGVEALVEERFAEFDGVVFDGLGRSGR